MESTEKMIKDLFPDESDASVAFIAAIADGETSGDLVMKKPEKRRSFDFDDAFFAELDELVNADFRNCGTGAVGGKQGFQPGNKCAGSGETTKGKAEGKKKDVHSDWVSKNPVSWQSYKDDYQNGLTTYESTFKSKTGDITAYGSPNEYSRDNAGSGGKGGKDDGVYIFNFSKEGYGYAASKTGDALSTMRRVMQRAVDLFNKPDVDALEFSAINSDRGRVRTYAYLTNWAQKRFPDAKAYYKETRGGRSAGTHIFVIANKKAQDGYLEWDYKNSPNPFWEFDHQDQFDGVDGRSVEDKQEKFLIPESILTKEFFEELGRLLDEDYESYNSRSVDFDDAFFAELDELVDADFRNCGTGAVGGKQGFQPGNKCAGSGETTKGKKATTDELVSAGSKQLKETGGFTVHPITGKSPKKGYMVATVRDEELILDKLTENKLAGFIQRNASNFAKDKNLHVGGWYNVEDGQIYLDLSTNVSSLSKAKSLAKKHQQIAIWDVANKDEINTEDLWKGDNANKEQERSVEGRTGRTRSTRERVSTQGQASRGQRGLDPVRLQSGRRERPSSNAEGDPRDGREVRIAKGREAGSESQEERNCGTGAVGGKQGFQPGNKCAGTGENTKGKAEGKENKKGSAPSSDLFPSGSQPFRTAVDDATTASGLDSSSIWDRSKGFRELPDRSKIEAFAKEQQSKSGKAMTPAGRKAYDALIDDIGTQYQALTEAGLKVYGWEGKGEPYAKVPGGTKVDSNMMRKMVAKDGEFRFFMTDKGFGTGAATKNHPMLKMTKYKTSDGKPLIANDLFRVVHDMVAHVRGGHSFSTKGEFNGMLTHATTLNKKAWPALFSETFAQNSVYEITNKFAPQNAYGSRKGAKLISVELENMMSSTDETERAVPSGDSDEPLGYWHLKQRPWLVDKLSKDEPSEQEKENG